MSLFTACRLRNLISIPPLFSVDEIQERDTRRGHVRGEAVGAGVWLLKTYTRMYADRVTSLVYLLKTVYRDDDNTEE